jgi:hypothetical protein
MLREDSIVMNFYNKVGTMGMADYQNYIGGLPVRNFSAGQLNRRRSGRDLQNGRRLHRRAQHQPRRPADAPLHARLR